MAQDRVGSGEMKIDVRQHEMVEVIVGFHLSLVDRSEWERELTLACGIDLLRVERLQMRNRLGNALLELVDGGLGVFVTRRLDAGEPRGAVLGELSRDLHLTRQREHVGREARIEQHRSVDLLGSRENSSLIENSGESIEANLQSGEGGL